MMNKLTLFPEKQVNLEQELKQNPLYNLVHPYSRYGLAVALVRLDKWAKFEDIENPTESDLIEILIQEIESGLNSFRFETFDNPETAEKLRFVYIKLEKLRQDKTLVQGKLSEMGKYLAPTILTTDGDAGDTFENAEEFLENLKIYEEFENDVEKIRAVLNTKKYLRGKKAEKKKFIELSRSFAPTTTKINNGRLSQSPPRANLLEAVCSIITTLTENKPSSFTNVRNTIIIPDLPMDELVEFVRLFNEMKDSQLGDSSDRKNPFNTKPSVDEKGKKSYKRPPIFDGNYPFAPRNSTFGAVGLLSAIGSWAKMANELTLAESVLKSLIGKPLYVISYDKIFQVQFSHHIVGLAIKDKLRTVIEKLSFGTKLYSEIENEEKGKKRWKLPNYQLFDLMTNRFLQFFDQSTFQDFLAFRAEYALEVNTLFEVYFMKENKIDREIVESARAYGQWLNLTAYLVAKEETKGKSYQDLIKQKAKVLVGFESLAMSGETPQDMLHRVSSQAGRLMQRDAPAKATKFMDWVMRGENGKTAQQMLIAYMRLQTEEEKNEQIKGDENNGN